MSHDLTCLVRVKETHQVPQQLTSRVDGGIARFSCPSQLARYVGDKCPRNLDFCMNVFS
jgi:hypothetical protein